jgi:glycosyltransferase involved in cell wall biosynthesis
MAAGVPIIASDLPSLREVLQDRSNALLFHPKAPASLADAIRTLHEAPDFARELAHQAFLDIHKYTWEARAASLLQVIQPRELAAS